MVPNRILQTSIHSRNEQIRQYQESQSESLATELLRRYEPMVKMAANKMARNHQALYDDLYQVGQMSLLRSLRQFDVEAGTEFEPYAMKSMIGHMKNYLRDKSWYVQVPRRIKEKGMRVQQAIDTLTIQMERSPRVEEIASHLGLTVEETMEILAGREYYQPASLDMPLKEEEGSGTIGDMIGTEPKEYDSVENRIDLEAALSHLGAEEKKVIHLAFIQGESQRTIAKRLGISQMSVCRIQKRAVEKLKRRLRPTREIVDG